MLLVLSCQTILIIQRSSAEKVFDVKRSSAGINSIGSASISGNENVITLTRTHNLITGESVRVISDTGQLPDGLTPNTVAFAVTTGTGITKL